MSRKVIQFRPPVPDPEDKPFRFEGLLFLHTRTPGGRTKLEIVEGGTMDPDVEALLEEELAALRKVHDEKENLRRKIRTGRGLNDLKLSKKEVAALVLQFTSLDALHNAMSRTLDSPLLVVWMEKHRKIATPADEPEAEREWQERLKVTDLPRGESES